MAIFPGSAIPSAVSDYEIDNSLRFDGSGNLYKTFSTAGNRKTWTFSCWLKTPPAVSADTKGSIFGVDGGSPGAQFLFDDDGAFVFYNNDGSSNTIALKTSQVFRDPASWIHFCLALDTTQATDSDRVKLYINGSRVTAFSTATYPAQNSDCAINDNDKHSVGKDYRWNDVWHGYMAEVYFIDGSSLGADSFGELDSDTNQWKPKDASGLTFGTNGFYQKYAGTELATSFTDSSATTWTAPAGVTSVDYLVVAGGGGGGSSVTGATGTGYNAGGGGGAGGMLTGTLTVVPGTAYTVTVGSGGTAGSASNGGDGGDSVFASITATGGGGGGRGGSAGRAGGSSGGSGSAGGTPGSATAGQGNTGGSSSAWGGGGGGGASANGTNGDTGTNSYGGPGGAGTASSITGSSVTYSGGGGGGSTSGYNASGGSGGGGTGGSYNNTDATAGTANTGGGGGGAGGVDASTALNGGAGGSGIVVIDDGTTVTSFTSSHSAHTITANGNVTQTRAQKKVGDSSIKFDGSGDYLTVPSSNDWDFWDSDFTMECWVRFNNVTANQAIWYQGGGTAPEVNVHFAFADTEGFKMYQRNTSSPVALNQGSNSGWSADTWYHVALVRNGSSYVMYRDGTSIATLTDSTTIMESINNVGVIGTMYSGGTYSGSPFNGYIDEYRISNTARYTSSFTPQTTAFTADSNTLLLIHSNWDGGLGLDSSGQGNNFTVTNLVATDQMVDSPTNNFCTLNSVDLSWSYATGQTIGPPTLSEGNLKSTKTSGSGGYEQARGTIAVDSGKWYFEMLLSAVGSSNHQSFGICTTSTDSLRNWGGGQSTQWTYQNDGGTLNGSGADSGFSTYTTGDVVSCAFDADAGKIWWAKNGTWEGSGNPATGANARYTNVATQIASDGNSVSPFSVLYSSSASEFFNFGSDSSFAGAKTAQGNQDGNGVGDFFYEPPENFLALCSENLPVPEIKLPEDHFGTSTWSALSDGSAQSISQISFQPDWVWIKQRNGTYDHMLFDSVRGATKYLESNDNAIEATDAQTLTSFNSDGFSLGTANTVNGPNASNSYVGWAWKGGGAGVENTEGNITSSVSANTTAGFSVVKYTGSGNTSSTVGHGLSQAPELIIIKNLDESQNWKVGNDRIGTSPTADAWAQYKYLELNDGDAVTHDNDVWRTAPSATVFHLWQGISVNQSTKNFIAYCMHPVENYSKIGIYDGNNDNDGVFIYLGFKPEFFLAKNIDATESWEIWDGTREPYNKLSKKISPNTNDAEYTANTTTYAIDFLSNGVKLRTNYSAVNASNSFLFYAVAKNPFKYSRGS